jgi:hypothetical protein
MNTQIVARSMSVLRDRVPEFNGNARRVLLSVLQRACLKVNGDGGLDARAL